MFLIITIIAISVVFYYLWKQVAIFFRYRKLMNYLPGPKKILGFGNLFDILVSDEQFFKKLRQYSRDYRPIYSLSATDIYDTVNISGPEEFELVAATMKNISKGDTYFVLQRWLGEGLLTSTGSKWQIHRKILTPSFHFSILQQFVTIFSKETDKLVEILASKIEEPYVNVVPLISQFTLNTISETAMGSQLDMNNTEDKNFVSATFQLGKILFYRLMRPWLYNQMIYYYLTALGRKERRLLNILHTFTKNIVRSRSAKFEQLEENYNYSEKKKLAMLDLLLNAKANEGNINDEEIADEVNTFMFEGHDTTSMAICFTLMLLGYHKDVQELLYEEIIEVLGKKSNHPTLNELGELKYMERVIKESLRLYPSVPFIVRQLEEETITKQGYLLPQNVEVNIHIFDIHRNPDFWPDPEKFDPDRFLPENCINRHPFAYVPFSAGPRNCIGQKYAILEMKAVICGILKKFQIESVDTPDNIILVPDIVLRTAKEMLRIKFRLRI